MSGNLSATAKSLIRRSFRAAGLEITRRSRERPGSAANTVVPVPFGRFEIRMYADSRLPEAYARSATYSRELGRAVAAVVTKYPDLAAIDIGANYGDTLAIIKEAADIPVHCIEGDARVFELLQANLSQFTRVTAEQVLLGERVERITAEVEKAGWNLTLVPSAAPSARTFMLSTLDECARQLPDRTAYRFLKIDTEGFDCRIIRGGLSYISEVRPVIAMEYNRDNMRRIGDDGMDTLMLLRDLGYRDALFYDNMGRLLVAASLQDEALIGDLHDYANGRDGAMHYYDLCLFHADDADIGAAFTATERAWRLSQGG